MTLDVTDVDAVLSDWSSLAPGRSNRVSGLLEPGPHPLRLRVDGVERHRADYQLDETPAGTVVVELGHGVVSVTEARRSTTSMSDSPPEKRY